MKRVFLRILIASLLTLVVYVGFAFLWITLLNFIQNQAIKGILQALMTSAAYSACLMYITKVRDSVGITEFLSDYNGTPYVSFFADIKRIFTQEKLYLLGLCIATVSACVLLAVESIVFGKGVVSMVFMPLIVCSLLFGNGIISGIIGCIFSVLYICAAYIVAVALYRKKCHKDWLKNR